MIEIGIHEIVKNFGYKNVLSGACAEIMTGDRAAIVGRNGAGKTTLFKMIVGQEQPDSGTLSIRRGATVGYLEQIPTLQERDVTTREVLREPFAPVKELEALMRRLEASMATESDSAALEKLMEEYGQAQTRFAALDGYAMEEELARVINGFGLSPLLERSFHVLSGGQKTVVSLACTILRKPDILLLDEPTNHLDIKTLEWFEDFLVKYRGTVVMISHDRCFLDKTTNRTIWLEGGTCQEFAGNYSYSAGERERLLLLEFEQYKTQQKKVEAMKASIKRFREWGAQGDNEKFYRKAKELEKRLEKLELLERPQLEQNRLPIHFSGERTGREVLQVRNFSLLLGELALFEDVSLTICEREKTCLLGDNGTGKTTLLRAILGHSYDTLGTISLNPSAKIGYIPQEIRFSNPLDSVLEAFRKELAYRCSPQQARSILAGYHFFGESVFRRVDSLSGGEKVLVKLAALIQNQVNFLLLDEPTNHIDIETRELLEEALGEYRGTLLFVSHDRFFISRIATRIVEIRDHTLHNIPTGYTDCGERK